MENSLYAISGAILAALITSYFAYLKLQKEFMLNIKSKKIDYFHFSLIENGFDKINEYISLIHETIIKSQKNQSSMIDCREIVPPLFLLKVLDMRYKTNWYFIMLNLHNYIYNHTLASSKEINYQLIFKTLDCMLKEVYFFRRRQELNIESSIFRVYTWIIWYRILFKGKRKELQFLASSLLSSDMSNTK